VIDLDIWEGDGEAGWIGLSGGGNGDDGGVKVGVGGDIRHKSRLRPAVSFLDPEILRGISTGDTEHDSTAKDADLSALVFYGSFPTCVNVVDFRLLGIEQLKVEFRELVPGVGCSGGDAGGLGDGRGGGARAA